MPNFLEDYEPVEDRLRAFWSDHPDGRVMTTLVEHADGHYIVRAEVWRGDGLDWPAASGLAEESKSDRGVNATSALENCETSAIGRALANLGYAAKGKRPSREEMSKASGAAAGGVSTDSPAQDPAPGTTSGEGREPMMTAGVQSAESTTETASTKPSPGTTSVYGEVAGEEPGEGQPKPSPGSTDAPGPPHYPLTPAECSHLNSRSGRLLGPRSSPRGPVCPRCGLSYITVTESTSADLGSA